MPKNVPPKWIKQQPTIPEYYYLICCFRSNYEDRLAGTRGRNHSLGLFQLHQGRPSFFCYGTPKIVGGGGNRPITPPPWTPMLVPKVL